MLRQAKVLPAIVAAAVGLYACGGESSKGVAPEPESTGTTSAADSTGGGAAGARGASQGDDRHGEGSAARRLVYIQFDNVHFTRDNPDVPSDLEQMPHLLKFLTGEGTLLSNHHTPLIAHTADDIVTSLTGVYPDRHGQAVANSYTFFPAPGTSTFFDGFASSFTYWTDPVNPRTDPAFNMVTADGKNAPAPWVAFTRAGLNVGAVSIANIELENTKGDITTVFGATSPEAAEAKANPTQATSDFVGIAVHCAAGDATCSASNGGVADVLPDEPGGYAGYNGLFGHKFVAPVIAPSGLADLDGHPITGFPGFGGISASQALGYVAAMQEHGIPVTFAYISDAHGNHTGSEVAFGPGEAGYVAQLAAYDHAFDLFFQRLAADGITKDNTLFVVTADEGDHFAGGPPSPAGCDGVHVPCTYAKIGEIDANITTLLTGVDPSLAATPFDIHFDMAPAFAIKGNPAVGSPTARAFERASAKLTAVSPITGNTDTLTRYLADPVELKLLHMVTGDAQRTPNFVMFGDPDYFFSTSGGPPVEGPAFAWNHGGVAPEINDTWLGIAGPGVRRLGVDHHVWSDHTDIRPTILAVMGLSDAYADDGRVLVEALREGPAEGRDGELAELGRVYKAITAPVGPLGLASLRLSTKALASGDATDDAKYTAGEAFLGAVTTVRDDLVAKMKAALDGAEFRGQPIDRGQARAWIIEGEELVALVEAFDAAF